MAQSVKQKMHALSLSGPGGMRKGGDTTASDGRALSKDARMRRDAPYRETSALNPHMKICGPYPTSAGRACSPIAYPTCNKVSKCETCTVCKRKGRQKPTVVGF
jgi:hypothetical protein